MHWLVNGTFRFHECRLKTIIKGIGKAKAKLVHVLSTLLFFALQKMDRFHTIKPFVASTLKL